ncbi:UNVERIFIED_CONTAM: hypothetical protein HDU68_001860 [Siphonaria sp. JEL0065]|nr:hypothetical protein HDU68_001860 [Siphonaria sp. JEL0065]
MPYYFYESNDGTDDDEDGKEFDPVVGRFTNLHMPVTAFMSRLVDAECREASMFCLENNFELGNMAVGSCQSVHLHFIALRGNLHTIEAVDIVDVENGQVFELRKFMQVYAEDPRSH